MTPTQASLMPEGTMQGACLPATTVAVARFRTRDRFVGWLVEGRARKRSIYAKTLKPDMEVVSTWTPKEEEVRPAVSASARTGFCVYPERHQQLGTTKKTPVHSRKEGFITPVGSCLCVCVERGSQFKPQQYTYRQRQTVPS